MHENYNNSNKSYVNVVILNMHRIEKEINMKKNITWYMNDNIRSKFLDIEFRILHLYNS